MTLVLSVVTHDYVMQVCDRRLTDATTGELVDADAVKTVLWNGNMVFSYTGLATLPRPLRVHEQRQPGLSRRWPTNLWLAELLSLASGHDDAMELLRYETSRAVSSSALPAAQRGHTFIGVGWSVRTSSEPRPIWVEVGNLNPTRELLAESGALSDDAVAIVRSSRGEDTRELQAKIEAAHGPAAVGELLVEFLREVAKAPGPVGRDAFQICLPRTQMLAIAETGTWSMSNREPSVDHVTFRYIPDGEHDGVARGPTAVLGGNVAGELTTDAGRDSFVRIGLRPWPPDETQSRSGGPSVVFNP